MLFNSENKLNNINLIKHNKYMNIFYIIFNKIIEYFKIGM